MVANELREVPCPKGPLGLVLFDTEDGVRVGKLAEGSKLLAQVVPGDVLVSINGKPVSGDSNYVVARLKELSDSARKLVFRRSGDVSAFHSGFEGGGSDSAMPTPRGTSSLDDRRSMDSSGGCGGTLMDGSSGGRPSMDEAAGGGGGASPLFSRAPSDFKSASRRSSDHDLSLGDLSTMLRPEDCSPRLGALSAHKRRVIAVSGATSSSLDVMVDVRISHRPSESHRRDLPPSPPRWIVRRASMPTSTTMTSTPSLPFDQHAAPASRHHGAATTEVRTAGPPMSSTTVPGVSRPFSASAGTRSADGHGACCRQQHGARRLLSSFSVYLHCIFIFLSWFLYYFHVV